MESDDNILYINYLTMVIIMFFFLVPLAIFISLLMLAAIDSLMLDWVIGDFISAWTKHWLEGKKPKEN